MKYILSFCVCLCATFCYGQHQALEAKLAYQLAVENYGARKYSDALDYLKKAATAFGTTNPPIAFLKVMVSNEIVLQKESREGYSDLEKSIGEFERVKNKEDLGEEKLMEVYRIKIDLDKRKNAFEKLLKNKIALRSQFSAMMGRLCSEFPKTAGSLKEFIYGLPTNWGELRWNGLLVNDKRMEKILKSSAIGFTTGSDIGKFYLESLETDETQNKNIKKYIVRKIVKCHKRAKDNVSRKVTVDEICEILNISPKLWNQFTEGGDPVIKRLNNGYLLTYALVIKGTEGRHNYFQFLIHEKTYGYACEEIQIDIFENTI